MTPLRITPIDVKAYKAHLLDWQDMRTREGALVADFEWARIWRCSQELPRGRGPCVGQPDSDVSLRTYDGC